MELGILVNPKAKHERLDFHIEACQFYGLTPILLTFKELAQKRSFPQVIHNRTYAKTEHERQLLLDTSKRSYFYNGGNHYSKMVIHQKLMLNPFLRANLPGTIVATEQSIRMWMRKYERLILKPDIGSVGRGVMQLHKKSGKWYWTNENESLPFQKLPKPLLRIIQIRTYLVQQQLPLYTYEGNPFDVRVSVQRNERGNWQVTGMAGKVAAPNQLVTNVARGGRVIAIEDVLSAQHRFALSQFALAVALQLSLFVPNLADIGLDLGITSAGFPMFIECNFRDLRYCFGEINQIEIWKASYYNPIGYGKWILHKKNNGFAL